MNGLENNLNLFLLKIFRVSTVRYKVRSSIFYKKQMRYF